MLSFPRPQRSLDAVETSLVSLARCQNPQYGPLAESLETCFFAEADILLTGQLRNHRPNEVRNGYRAS